MDSQAKVVDDFDEKHLISEEDKGSEIESGSNKKENDTSEHPHENAEIVTAEDLNPSNEQQDERNQLIFGLGGRERLYSIQSDYSAHGNPAHKPALAQLV